ncbi:MAG: hypothetical protein P8X55_05105 [Desulfosarcinaceae bacterium]
MAKQNPSREKSEIEQAGEDLFNYAIDREDIKYLVALLPGESTVNRSKVDYELQLLKIVTVGWTISYHLMEHPLKDVLSELFWQSIQTFSRTLSETTGLMIGKDIDYFDTLKTCLNNYLDVLARQPETSQPARIIGTEFARRCGDANDLFTFMTGSKLFLSASTRVKQYLEGALARRQ